MMQVMYAIEIPYGESVKRVGIKMPEGVDKSTFEDFASGVAHTLKEMPNNRYGQATLAHLREKGLIEFL